MESARTQTLIPKAVAERFNFYSIDKVIENFRDVSLHELVRVNSGTKFLDSAIKFCYTFDYASLNLTVLHARDQHCAPDAPHLANAYVKQQMHSVSGEQKDLCYYTYGPEDLVRFLELNKDNHYTYLPITVHATDSANGFRHDMLLIFDNRTKFFYWFDGRNRDDYMQHAKNMPANVFDILFTQIASICRIGYAYEPSESWQIQGVLQPIMSFGQLDFALSTTWCYLTMTMLDYYESPTGYLSALDSMNKVDQFHLLYSSLLHMVGVYKYHKNVPVASQVNLTEERVPTLDIPMPAPSTLPRQYPNLAPRRPDVAVPTSNPNYPPVTVNAMSPMPISDSFEHEDRKKKQCLVM